MYDQSMAAEAVPRPSEENFRKNLRARREAIGLTQAELAARLQRLGHAFVQQTVAKIESGNRPIRLDEAVALALATECSLDELASPLLPETPEAVRAALKAARQRLAEEEREFPKRERLLEEARAEYEEVQDAVGGYKLALVLARARVDELEHRLAEIEKGEPAKGARGGKRQAKG